MQTSKQTSLALNPEQIARTAYSLWEQAGCPAAQDLDFWLQAERQLRQSLKTQSAEPKAAATQLASPAPSKAVSFVRAQSF